MIAKQILIQWYYRVLCYPGETRIKLTIGQYFYCKGMWKCIHDICSKRHTYQFLKREKRICSKLPPKQVFSENRYDIPIVLIEISSMPIARAAPAFHKVELV